MPWQANLQFRYIEDVFSETLTQNEKASISNTAEIDKHSANQMSQIFDGMRSTGLTASSSSGDTLMDAAISNGTQSGDSFFNRVGPRPRAACPPPDQKLKLVMALNQWSSIGDRNDTINHQLSFRRQH